MDPSNLPERLEIQPTGPLHGRIRPPGSKSYTNRALLVAALAEGTSTLRGALDSEDTRLMMEGLRQLGIGVELDLAGSDARRSSLEIHVKGCAGGIPARQADLEVGNSGTTVRFLTAMVALGEGTYRLDGTARMRERPIEPLLEALRRLGADCFSELGTGCPPVVVHSCGLGGGTVQLRGDVSSQFLSGLLMAAPYARRDVVVELVSALVSEPYVAMTLDVMRRFGVSALAPPLKREQKEMRAARYVVPAPRCYRATDYTVEPDASAASYFFAAAAITGGTVTVEGLSSNSLQGDVAFVELLRQIGCGVEYREDGLTVTGGKLRGIDADMTHISDTVPTLAVVALFAEGPTTIRGVAHVRRKETDRIAALAAELAKFGAGVREQPDGLVIQPPAGLAPAAAPRHPPGLATGSGDYVIETYDDHRMAMSFALAGLRIPRVTILNPACTAKTYPHFFEDLAALRSQRLGQG